MDTPTVTPRTAREAGDGIFGTSVGRSARAKEGRDAPGSQPAGSEGRDRTRAGSDFREAGIGLAIAVLIMAPLVGLGGVRVYTEWRAKEDARLAEIEAGQAYERLIASPAGQQLDVAEAVRGRDMFMTVCIACHGASGTGVEGLGKNLVESDFVARTGDEGLYRYMLTGRPSARPMPMPPKGGRSDIADEDFRPIVAYLRGLQDPRRLPELPAMVVAAPTEADKAAALAAAGGDAELAEYIASGDKLFHSTCIACHGKGGVGIAGNGKALAKNAFIQSLGEEELLAFLKVGRSPSDPKNTTGIQMPPKGGNPALSEDDLLDIISYLRTLQGTVPASAGVEK